MKILQQLPLPADARVLDHTSELAQILDGSAAYFPVADTAPIAADVSDALGIGAPIRSDISLVIATSGTTGIPKGAQHGPSSLAASAAATTDRLGGPGNWLLALSPTHIAGLQVLLRAYAAGLRPAVLDVHDGFDPDVFAAALDGLDGPRRYTSLVPIQLRKVLDSPRATAALESVDAVLVGGAATPTMLLRRAIDAGIPIIRTYGMSETAGGCVYDGIGLPGVSVDLLDPNPHGVGRVVLAGPMVAAGYRGLPDHPAFASPGRFRTDDLGRIDDGVLHIIGRADEAISSGGLTIVPQVVETLIIEDSAVADCAVVGLPDERLGEKVVAFVVPSGRNRVDVNRIRGIVAERLGRYAAPREVIELSALPTRGPGKIDRRALRERFSGTPERPL
ncbi:MAG: o-succinylbenzoate--CoA ligase [Gordonia sp. (in: high G+C Gram-positive bacteria)]